VSAITACLYPSSSSLVGEATRDTKRKAPSRLVETGLFSRQRQEPAWGPADASTRQTGTCSARKKCPAHRERRGCVQSRTTRLRCRYPRAGGFLACCDDKPSLGDQLHFSSRDSLPRINDTVKRLRLAQSPFGSNGSPYLGGAISAIFGRGKSIAVGQFKVIILTPASNTDGLKIVGGVRVGRQTMVSVVALLCAAGIAPADCTRENAIDVVAISNAPDELSCMRDSMMTLASLAVRPEPDAYWKVLCEASRERISIVADQPNAAQDQVSAPVP